LYEQVIAEHLTIDEVASIKDLFDKLDVQKKGAITLDELKDGLRKQGHDITDSDARVLMDAVSTNTLFFFSKFYHVCFVSITHLSGVQLYSF
jgi:Ca2+-binding EF-hand superfamily protein